MKKILFALVLLSSSSAWAQLPNASFESWSSVTSIWSYSPFILADTFSFNNPTDWTTLNQVTGNRYLGGNFFVSQSTDAVTGNFSLRMETDTIYVGLLPDSNLILPGFAVNGNFPVDLAAILEASGSVSPAIFVGAGIPETSRKQKMRFKAKYIPVQNDSLLAWAVLKSNGMVIAEAKINDPTPLPNFTTLEADFTYYSCDDPDTLVVMFGSSTPNFSTAFSGNSELAAGSVLYIDDIEFIDLPNSTNIPPIANFDEAFTFQNQAVTIPVLGNDSDCENASLQLGILSSPMNGSVVLVGSDSLRYTPNTNWAGADTLFYTISDGTYQASTYVRINVFVVGGLNNKEPLYCKLIPNPSQGVFCLDLEPSQKYQPLEMEILNLEGKQMAATSEPCFDGTFLSSGLYFVKIKTKDFHIYKKLEIR
jgi:hypothetical protein